MRALTLVLLTLVVGTVGASPPDMMVSPSNSMVEALQHWTGWYVGGNVGYSWGGSDVSYVQEPGIGNIFGVDVVNGIPGLALNGELHPETAISGVQGGYDYQTSRLVVGFVADFDYRRGGDKSLIGPLFPLSMIFWNSLRTKNGWACYVAASDLLLPTPG